MKYNELAKEEIKCHPPIYFVGRLAQFKYFNMDHIILNSMKLADKILTGWNDGTKNISSELI